jgi:hypothetical protein
LIFNPYLLFFLIILFIHPLGLFVLGFTALFDINHSFFLGEFLFFMMIGFLLILLIVILTLNLILMINLIIKGNERHPLTVMGF